MRPGWLTRQLDRAALEVRAFDLIDALYTQGRLGEAVEE